MRLSALIWIHLFCFVFAIILIDWSRAGWCLHLSIILTGEEINVNFLVSIWYHLSIVFKMTSTSAFLWLVISLLRIHGIKIWGAQKDIYSRYLLQQNVKS